VTRNSLVQALADSRDGGFGAGFTPPRVGEIGFEAEAPIDGLIDYGEILIQSTRHPPSIATSRTRCFRPLGRYPTKGTAES
jgi:hypothetical protein